MADAPRYVQNPAVSQTEVETDTFLVEPGSQEVFYLDHVGGALWRLLGAPHSRAEIFALFAEAFPETAPGVIQDDVAAVLDEMERRALILRKD